MGACGCGGEDDAGRVKSQEEINRMKLNIEKLRREVETKEQKADLARRESESQAKRLEQLVSDMQSLSSSKPEDVARLQKQFAACEADNNFSTLGSQVPCISLSPHLN